MPLNNRQSRVDIRRSIAALIALVLFVLPTLSAHQYSFEEVASGLKDKDVSTRLRAIQILKDADYAEAADPIAAVLTDADDRVQLAAIDAERALFTNRVVPRRRKVGLIIEVRTVAGGDAAAAGQLGLKPRTVPSHLLTNIAVALRDDNPRVRAEAVNLASLLGPVSCARLDRLKPETTACADIGNALIDNINSREAPVRRAAMQVLGQLRYQNAVQALLDQYSYRQRGPDAMAALEGLAGIGHPTSVSVFEDLLTNANVDMRRFAVEGLARIGNPDVLPALQQLGQTERSTSVLLALHYANVKLGGTDGSLQQIVASLGDESQRLLVLRYLLDLSPTVAPLLAESLLKDESTDIRRLIADVLGFSRNDAVFPALAAAATDADPDVAAAAVQALERLKL